MNQPELAEHEQVPEISMDGWDSLDNTIIVTYRDRKENLSMFIDSMGELPHNWQLVVINAGSSVSLDDLMLAHRTNNILWMNVPYTGIFWKTKLLNLGISRCMSTYTTFLDCDCILPRNFVKIVDKILQVNIDKKISYSCKKYNTKIAEEIDGKVTGNSNFTLKTDILMELSGFNEDFIGWGLEDWEFNMRYHKKYGDTYIVPDFVIDQSDHTYNSDWRNIEFENDNFKLFQALKADNFPDYEKPEDWGNFADYINVEMENKMNKNTSFMEADGIRYWNGKKVCMVDTTVVY